MYYSNKPGWWFGTCVSFFRLDWEFHHPLTDEINDFQRGGPTPNLQVMLYEWLRFLDPTSGHRPTELVSGPAG